MGGSDEDISDSDDALMAVARARVGRVLRGKYRIESVLGVGGMGFVYEAVHRNGRRVALKMLHPELSLRPDIRKRFLLEGQAANAVKHPGVVAVIDDDLAEDGAAFLVMELLEGVSVEDLWRDNGGRLDARTVLEIARQLSEVLIAAHDVGVVHRDIKPANLFLTPHRELKVLDFGLARVRDAARGARHTSTGAVLGTPAFLPPEQASGHTSQIDGQTDIWAVGATLFTLLSGATVHEGQSAQHLVILAATVPPRSLAAVLPAADEQLVALVDRALAFEKTKRWANARELHAAIRLAIDKAGGPAVDAASVAAPALADPSALKTLESGRDVTKTGHLVGTRTSQPVSSAAATTPMRRKNFGRRMVRAVRTALASVPMTTEIWRRRAYLAAAGGILAAAVALISASVGIRARGQAADPPAAPTQSIFPPPPMPSHQAPSAFPTSSVPPTPVASSPASASGAATASATSATGAVRSAPRGATGSAKSGCSPPYTIDSDGIQHFKDECVQ